MASLGEIVINLQMEFAQFKAATEKAVAELGKIEKSTKKTADAMGNFEKMMGRLQRTLTAFAGVFVFREITGTISSAVNAMIQFNSELETANLGIASILLSQGKFTNSIGQSVEGYDALISAQQMSGKIIEQLQVDNLQTVATFQQLVRAFQQTLAPAMEKGFNLQQVREYTVAMVKAAGALGLNLDMLAEETRSMLRGTITARTTLIATALGITNEQVRQFEGNAQGLFDFVMGKLKAFSDAGVESQKTWAGMVSNLKDAFDMLLGTGLKPLFDFLKQEMKDLTDLIIVLNKETGKLELNPKFVKSLELISTFITTTGKLGISTMKWGVALGPVGMILEEIAKNQEKAKEAAENMSEVTFVPSVDLRMKEEMARAEQGAKSAKTIGEEWVQAYEPIINAMKELKLTSEITMKAELKNAMAVLPELQNQWQKTGKGARDYVEALKAVIGMMEKLAGPDIHDQIIKNELDYQKALEQIPVDDPERAKKVQALIDGWLKAKKEIEAKKIQPEIDIPNLEQNLQDMKVKVIQMYGDIFETVQQEIKQDKVVIEFDETKVSGTFDTMYEWFKEFKSKIESTPIKITIEGDIGGGEGWPGVGGETLQDQAEGAAEGLQNIQDKFGDGIDIPINIYGIGSTRKPITDKIREIIAEFGGLDKALSGMEAEINLAELTAEYKKLAQQLQSTKMYPQSVANVLSWGGNPSAWFTIPPAFWDQYRQQITDLTEQMRILQMKIDYEMLKAYGGSMQFGGIVAKTGYYKLHEGERVTAKSVSMGDINIHLSGGTSKEQAKEIAKQLALIIKYKRSGDLAEYV